MEGKGRFFFFSVLQGNAGVKTLPTSHRPYLPWIWLNRLKNPTADAEMLLVFTPKISRRYDKAFWQNRFSGKVYLYF